MATVTYIHILFSGILFLNIECKYYQCISMSFLVLGYFCTNALSIYSFVNMNGCHGHNMKNNEFVLFKICYITCALYLIIFGVCMLYVIILCVSSTYVLVKKYAEYVSKLKQKKYKKNGQFIEIKN